MCYNRSSAESHTLSQSVIPFVKAVSASMTLLVSVQRILAYRSRARASNRGDSLLLPMATSRQARPVAISF